MHKHQSAEEETINQIYLSHKILIAHSNDFLYSTQIVHTFLSQSACEVLTRPKIHGGFPSGLNAICAVIISYCASLRLWSHILKITIMEGFLTLPSTNLDTKNSSDAR